MRVCVRFGSLEEGGVSPAQARRRARRGIGGSGAGWGGKEMLPDLGSFSSAGINWVFLEYVFSRKSIYYALVRSCGRVCVFIQRRLRRWLGGGLGPFLYTPN